jgi:transposase
LGKDRAFVAFEREAWEPMERPSNHFERNPVEIWDRRSLERSSRALWFLENLLYRFTRWQKDGTWDRLLKYVQTYSHAVSDVDWTVFVDSMIVRAHQHAAGAPKKGESSLPK